MLEGKILMGPFFKVQFSNITVANYLYLQTYSLSPWHVSSLRVARRLQTFARSRVIVLALKFRNKLHNLSNSVISPKILKNNQVSNINNLNSIKICAYQKDFYDVRFNISSTAV